MSKKKNDGFNTPFASLKSLVKKDEPKPSPARTSHSPTRRDKPASGGDDERVFLDAMAGVAPISRRHQLPVNVPQINARIVSEEAEALAQLYDLVSDRGQFALSNTADAIEGAAPGVDQRLVAALRRGDFAYQAQLELHGLSKDEATKAVDQFLTQSKRDGKRCVLLVHGRAELAKDQLPALKAQLELWLSRGRLGKLALAFCSARPNDGGAGALYVLLRR